MAVTHDADESERDPWDDEQRNWSFFHGGDDRRDDHRDDHRDDRRDDRRDGRRDDRAPSIWKRVTQSANSDADYYWNTETNDTTWDLPEGEDLELIETIEA